MSWHWFLDGWIVVTGMLCAMSAALLGNFLVLRRMSLLGDGISHAVLPGLAVAFLLTGSRASWPMFVGAMILGVLTAAATQWIRRVGNVDEGASLGIVFTTLFALGLVAIEHTAHRVDLDPGCVLFGSIELTPLDTVRCGGVLVPQAALVLGGCLLVNGLFVGLFFRPLKISVFDAAMARSQGIPVGFLHYGLMILVSVTAVASFESVGSVLVVAMMICPAAAAWILAKRLGGMIAWSLVLGGVCAMVGHFLAIALPSYWGISSVSTAGMMSLVAGCAVALAAMFGPKSRVWRWGSRWTNKGHSG